MKSRNVVGLVVATLCVVLLIFTDQYFSLGFSKRVTGILAPVGVVVSSTGQQISSFFGNFVHIGTLQKDNRDLKDKLEAALAEVARLSESKKENDSLRADLGFKINGGLTLTPGYVSYFDPGLKDGITVKVDDVTGLKVGNAVLSQGFLVGRVANIDGLTVRVLLITDSTSSIPAAIQNKDITGIAKGKIGNGLTVEQVPQSDNVVKGDTVLTSGLGGDLPKGLIIGRVDEVQKVNGSIFQSITLQPMVEFTQLERVMIAR